MHCQARLPFLALAALVLTAPPAWAGEAAPRARFTPEYQALHRGRIEVLVPEVYELVNVAIALTPTAAASPGRVATDNDYHARVVSHFDRWREHPFVQGLDAELAREPILAYIRLKLDAYAFEFDGEGRIARSAPYDRIADDGDANALLPLLAAMQSFADATGFRAFYAANAAHYEGQVGFLQARVDIPGMLRWLEERFPGVRPYDGVKVAFSPLAGDIQNMVRFEDGGYRELQVHVNFPYRQRPELSEAGNAVWRGTLIFGELNHGFLNPVSESMAGRIDAAIACPGDWTRPDNLEAYPDDLALFNEYLNFGLIDLYHHDRMGEADRRAARARIQAVMTEGRGFPRFAAFDDFLLARYLARAPGEGIPALYPALIDWFAAQPPGPGCDAGRGSAPPPAE